MNKYLEQGDLPEEDIKLALRKRTLALEIFPMLCGSAFKNKGVQAMLDAVVEYLPAPTDVPAIEAHDIDDYEKIIVRNAKDEEPFSALAFKIMTDKYVGALTFIRVYSGVLKQGDSVYNSRNGKNERIGRLVQMHANEQKAIDEVRAGDIAACVGLKDVFTGTTLADLQKPVVLERMIFPEPVISQAVEPKTKADQEKWVSPCRASRRKIRRSACSPTKRPARRSCRAWASCISKFSSTA